MTLFMISLAGIPGTAGFMGKWQVFSAAVAAGQVPLAIVGVLMSVVSVYYYLRVPVLMYMREPGSETPRLGTGTGEAIVLGVCALAVLYLGIVPNGWIDVLGWARESVRGLLAS
jgi:NADH-quinone oxidoreductase subunit N